MLKVLSIGNSFSQDAHRYLNKVSKAAGEEIKSVNLFIGGCKLSRHYKNMNNDDRAYGLEFNGEQTGFFVSIKEALQNCEWDYITFQQQSSDSAYYDTFQPYLNTLVDYAKLHAPKSKYILHQTWAYENSSDILKRYGYDDQRVMFDCIKKSYDKAKNDINAEFIIPCGQSMQNLVEEGFKVHRDSYHASFGLGRFALALTWYEMLTGNSCENICFSDFDEPVSDDEYKAAIKAAHKATSEYK